VAATLPSLSWHIRIALYLRDKMGIVPGFEHDTVFARRLDCVAPESAWRGMSALLRPDLG